MLNPREGLGIAFQITGIFVEKVSSGFGTDMEKGTGSFGGVGRLLGGGG